MPRRRKAARALRRGHKPRELRTLAEMKAWVATATEDKILAALELHGQDDGWDGLCWSQACRQELDERWRTWLRAATPMTTDEQILGAVRRFDRAGQDQDPMKWVRWLRHSLDDRASSVAQDPQDAGRIKLPNAGDD